MKKSKYQGWVYEAVNTGNIEAVQALLEDGFQTEGFKLNHKNTNLIQSSLHRHNYLMVSFLLSHSGYIPEFSHVLGDQLVEACVRADLKTISYLTNYEEKISLERAVLPPVYQCKNLVLTPVHLWTALDSNQLEAFNYILSQKNTSLDNFLQSPEPEINYDSLAHRSLYRLLRIDSLETAALLFAQLKPESKNRIFNFERDGTLFDLCKNGSVAALSFVLKPEYYSEGGVLEGIPYPDLASLGLQNKLYKSACLGAGHTALYLLNQHCLDIEIAEAFVIAGLSNNSSLIHHFLSTPEYASQIDADNLVPDLFILACQKNLKNIVKYFLNTNSFCLENSPQIVEFIQKSEYPHKESIVMAFEKIQLEKILSPNLSTLEQDLLPKSTTSKRLSKI